MLLQAQWSYSLRDYAIISSIITYRSCVCPDKQPKSKIFRTNPTMVTLLILSAGRNRMICGLILLKKRERGNKAERQRGKEAKLAKRQKRHRGKEATSPKSPEGATSIRIG